MEIDEFSKKFAREDNEAHKLAIEAIAKAISSPVFGNVFEYQNRLAQQAVEALLRGPELKIVHTAMQTAERQAAEQAAAIICNPRVIENLDSQLRSLVSVINRSAFVGFTDDFVKHREQEAEKLTDGLLSSIAPPRVDFRQLRDRFDYNVRPVYSPPAPEPVESGAANFMRILDEHIEAKKQQAEESGSTLAVRCKAPGGDEIRVLQLKVSDDHFVSVMGIDQFGQVREFIGHHSSVAITIDVVPVSEEFESSEDNEPSN